MEEQFSRRTRSKNNNTDSVVVVVDRISALPDCILGVIISFLPTRQVVATSLLSKRWKSVWLDVHSLHFDFYHRVAPHSDENIAFIRFVHRFLLLIRAKPLNKFKLDWSAGFISSHVICWIDAAIIRNVREITLLLGEGEIFKLPISGFNCDSLRSLEVNNITFVNDTTGVSLPRLETLKVDVVCFTSEDAFEKLINGCPMLHHLDINVCSSTNAVEGDFMYIVSAPSLRHLDFHIWDRRCTLKLNAPSLECLNLHGSISKIFVDKSLSSLVEAVVHIEMDEHDLSHNLIVEVVRALQHAKFLNTSGRVVRALGLATPSLSTKFKRLVNLAVHTECCCSLQDFVHNFENLEELDIYQAGWWQPVTIDVPHDHSRWTDPVVVPRCLSKSLRMVRLTGYKGLEDEREMIRYMLEHGVALKVLQIHCKNKEDEEKLLQEICEFPRKCPACKVSTWKI